MKEKLSRFGWEVVEYLRRMVTPFVLNLMFGITMFAVLAIGVDEAELVLNILLFALCCLAGFIYFRAAGEAPYKMKETGDLYREGKVPGEGGANGKYRPAKEYHWYKGLTIGLAVCLIPVILILVGAIAGNRAALTVMVFVCGWAYSPVFSIYSMATGADTFAMWLMWYGFILLALYLVCCIVGYELGARKERRRQRSLEERSERIEQQKQARLEKQKALNLQREEQKRSRGGKGGR